MNTHTDKMLGSQSRSAAPKTPPKASSNATTFQLVDNRPEALAQNKLQGITNNSPQAQQAAQLQAILDSYAASQERPIQKKGLPLDLKSEHAPVQRLMKKMNIDKKTYRHLTMSTVFLYAEFNGRPVGANGIFHTTPRKHAEENLIAAVEHNNLTQGTLHVYLSTSPCSSTFSTRTDGHEGCQERLESLRSRDILPIVHADHLYQPPAVGAMERESGLPTGFSSHGAAAASAFPIHFSHLPKPLAAGPDLSEKELHGPVAQLRAAFSGSLRSSQSVPAKWHPLVPPTSE